MAKEEIHQNSTSATSCNPLIPQKELMREGHLFSYLLIILFAISIANQQHLPKQANCILNTKHCRLNTAIHATVTSITSSSAFTFFSHNWYFHIAHTVNCWEDMKVWPSPLHSLWKQLYDEFCGSERSLK